MPSVNIDIEIKVLRDEQLINEIAVLHEDCFKKYLIGQLGQDFACFLYRRVLNSPQGILIGAFLDRKLIGLIAGVSNNENLYDAAFFQTALIAILKRFWNCFPLTLNILRNQFGFLGYKKTKQAELIAVFIDQSYRNQGIGKKLINEFEKFLKDQRVLDYIVLTELKFSLAYRLYDKGGCSIVWDRKVLGHHLRVYRKKI